MAGDSDLSRAAEKGKGKAVDGDQKAEESKKGKDVSLVINGKKDDEKTEGLPPLPSSSIVPGGGS